MHPYLQRLYVPVNVQQFFEPYLNADHNGDLVFSYGHETEVFGLAFHRVPIAENLWIAGNQNLAMVRQVFICESAMEAIAYLSMNFVAFRDFENLLFIATGSKPNTEQFRYILQNLPGKAFTLISSKDLLGRVCDLKAAAGIRKMPVAVAFENEQLKIHFRFRTYTFSPDGFSLNFFEKLSGYQFNLKTSKPKDFNCWLDQLKAFAF
jgi:hypothetical protein